MTNKRVITMIDLFTRDKTVELVCDLLANGIIDFISAKKLRVQIVMVNTLANVIYNLALRDMLMPPPPETGTDAEKKDKRTHGQAVLWEVAILTAVRFFLTPMISGGGKPRMMNVILETAAAKGTSDLLLQIKMENDVVKSVPL